MFVNLCLRSPVTYSTRPLQVLWLSLSHVCGPVVGARKLSVVFCGGGSLERLCPTHHAPALSLCSHMGSASQTLPHLGSQPLSPQFTEHLLIIIVYPLHLPVGTQENWIASFGLSALLQPVELQLAQLGTSYHPGVLLNLWHLCWCLLSLYSLFREFPKSILKH